MQQKPTNSVVTFASILDSIVLLLDHIRVIRYDDHGARPRCKSSNFWAIKPITSKFPRRMKIGYIETVRMSTLIHNMVSNQTLVYITSNQTWYGVVIHGK
jgi:hypothetical protein